MKKGANYETIGTVWSRFLKKLFKQFFIHSRRPGEIYSKMLSFVDVGKILSVCYYFLLFGHPYFLTFLY